MSSAGGAGGGVGLALLKLGAAAFGAAEKALKRLLVVQPVADAAGVKGLPCCPVYPCTLPGQGWEGSVQAGVGQSSEHLLGRLQAWAPCRKSGL